MTYFKGAMFWYGQGHPGWIAKSAWYDLWRRFPKSVWGWRKWWNCYI